MISIISYHLSGKFHKILPFVISIIPVLEKSPVSFPAEAMEYRNIVPDSVYSSSDVLQKKAAAMADAYSAYFTSLTDRYRIYGSSPSHQAQMRQRENINKILGQSNSARSIASDSSSKPGLHFPFTVGHFFLFVQSTARFHFGAAPFFLFSFAASSGLAAHQ